MYNRLQYLCILQGKSLIVINNGGKANPVVHNHAVHEIRE